MTPGESETEAMSSLWVNGIVSHRDKQPYVQLSTEKGIFAQLTMAEARHVALDILQMSARTEADVMIHKFFDAQDFPKQAASALMVAFRDFRAALDAEQVEHDNQEPPE